MFESRGVPELRSFGFSLSSTDCDHCAGLRCEVDQKADNFLHLMLNSSYNLLFDCSVNSVAKGTSWVRVIIVACQTVLIARIRRR